jgi:hypothetical protein
LPFPFTADFWITAPEFVSPPEFSKHYSKDVKKTWPGKEKAFIFVRNAAWNRRNGTESVPVAASGIPSTKKSWNLQRKKLWESVGQGLED